MAYKVTMVDRIENRSGNIGQDNPQPTQDYAIFVESVVVDQQPHYYDTISRSSMPAGGEQTLKKE